MEALTQSSPKVPQIPIVTGLQFVEGLCGPVNPSRHCPNKVLVGFCFQLTQLTPLKTLLEASMLKHFKTIWFENTWHLIARLVVFSPPRFELTTSRDVIEIIVRWATVLYQMISQLCLYDAPVFKKVNESIVWLKYIYWISNQTFYKDIYKVGFLLVRKKQLFNKQDLQMLSPLALYWRVTSLFFKIM